MSLIVKDFQVFLLAEPMLIEESMEAWLESLGVDPEQTHFEGFDAERLIELAARRCYKSFHPGLNKNIKKVRTDSQEYHENILNQRHGSVLEHASATFAIERCSRIFTHELVRHRPGFAYSQESMRYVRMSDAQYVIPRFMKDDLETLEIVENALEFSRNVYRQLEDLFHIDNEDMTFNEKKILTSAFRRLIPDGVATGIVMTANFRSLRWLIENRTGPGVEEEMRRIVGRIAEICVHRWPYVFGDFTRQNDGTWVPKYSKV